MGERRNACKILAEKPVENKLLLKLKGKWEDNIKICIT
jgi:hypothetical protein